MSTCANCKWFTEVARFPTLIQTAAISSCRNPLNATVVLGGPFGDRVDILSLAPMPTSLDSVCDEFEQARHSPRD